MNSIYDSLTTKISANICFKEQPILEQAFMYAHISSFLTTLLLTIFNSSQ